MKFLVALTLTSLFSSNLFAAEELPPVEEAPAFTCTEIDGVVNDPVFVRGAFNLWSEDNPLCDRGDGVYFGSVTMDEAIEQTHFKIASSDWVSLMCSIDSKFPSEDLDELFSEEAAAPIFFGETSAVTCYNEAEQKEAGLPLIFTGMKAAFIPLGVYEFSLDLSSGMEKATLTVEVKSLPVPDAGLDDEVLF